ncbi:MAG: YmdB family metallophosphoesterase [Candidatus Gastranaerophilales bacterium]|nr:YmdB family metallophosphoesterase [Candidatus Gastranaerophilales bacterium]
MTNTIKILFFGDIVGRPGRFAVRDFLAENKKCHPELVSGSQVQNDRTGEESQNFFTIVNVENASHGFGLTEKNYNDLVEYGVDCMTSGNHIWDKKEIFNYVDDAEKLLRPFNYPDGTKGQGSRIFDFNGVKIGVINVLGRVFMSPVESQWTKVRDEILRIKQITPIIIIDFHAEATAEKMCFAKFCSELGVSAFFGTHTHIQTADERIINNMAYITDAGFCGTYESVIGMDYNTSLNRFTTVIPERYEVAQGDVVQINAVEVEIDTDLGFATSIKRISMIEDKRNKENED